MGRPLRVVIINKSDSTGGAAVVSRRLMDALCAQDVDARMLVVEKRLDSPRIERAATPSAIRRSFLAERLKIFLANGLNRADLFKVDTASDGLPLWRHPLVKEADVVCLNWTNQGMLSLKGLGKLLKEGKPVVQTMHDLWCMTGICHHPGLCERYQKGECGYCRFLGKMAGPNDLSRRVYSAKEKIYRGTERLHFVAVSNWLAGCAAKSGLLGNEPVSVIPNAFPIEDFSLGKGSRDGKFRLIIGAARLDDPVKGMPLLAAATKELRRKYPELAARTVLTAFGDIRDPHALDGISVELHTIGRVWSRKELARLYGESDAVLSTSLYETLPGTLIEGQACGAVPVSFNRGGQSDIVDHLRTGFIAELQTDASGDTDIGASAERFADGLAWAAEQPNSLRRTLRRAVEDKFSAEAVAKQYIGLFRRLLQERK